MTFPTPNNSSTGNSFIKLSISSGFITNKPFGLFQPLAIFAKNLLGATPADAVSWVLSHIVFCIALAIHVPLP